MRGIERHEGSLHRMQRVGRAEALDGGDRLPVVHHGEGQTGVDPPVVHVHGARATLALIAALLGPGEADVLAQAIEQRRPRIQADAMRLSVDTQLDAHGARVIAHVSGFGRRSLPQDVARFDGGDHPGRPRRREKRPAAEARHVVTGCCPFVRLLLRHGDLPYALKNASRSSLITVVVRRAHAVIERHWLELPWRMNTLSRARHYAGVKWLFPRLREVSLVRHARAHRVG
jgi:hypothetical protein